MGFRKGNQIVYIPGHADNMLHPDAEFGFITGFNQKGSAFCRYWRNPDRDELRTKANSEATLIEMIKRCDLKPQAEIDELLIKLGYGECQ